MTPAPDVYPQRCGDRGSIASLKGARPCNAELRSPYQTPYKGEFLTGKCLCGSNTFGVDFDPKIDRDFIRRTYRILAAYDGDYQSTLFANCMIGLLIVPNPRFFDIIPEDDAVDLDYWGVPYAAVTSFSAPGEGNPRPATIRGFVRSLRSAVAQGGLVARYDEGELKGFHFSDESGFDATLGIAELQELLGNFIGRLR